MSQLGRVGSLGPEGVARRMAEIRARMEAMRPPVPTPATPAFEPSGPQGAIGGGGTQPLDPRDLGMSVSPTHSPLREQARRSAEEAGIDPFLFEALVSVESGFNPRATSPKGAMGLAQLMPGTARMLGVTDAYDPSQNLNAGARYLAQMLRQFGSEELALAAYNAGPGNVTRYGGIPPFAETQSYVQRVLAQRQALSLTAGQIGLPR